MFILSCPSVADSESGCNSASKSNSIPQKNAPRQASLERRTNPNQHNRRIRSTESTHSATHSGEHSG